ncbi:MAG: M20/M25/M40 family metallo-hydrolase [Calditrichaeota bacterium]|nr:MAG: M20/M25/M40 family metallo-hydrolase [Calditrichota bacterium]
MFKRIFLSMGILVALIAAVVLFRAVQFTPEEAPVPPSAGEQFVPDTQQVVAHLAQAVQFPTVSYQDSTRFPADAFAAFREFLRRTFPLAHQKLSPRVINGGALLFIWPGQDTSLAPVVLMAHQDVVPVPPETAEQWEHPPFSGAVGDGYVWGRGTLDDKSSLMAILEAVEHLLSRGFRPPRTVYLAFGHDEEVGGRRGAAQIAEWFRSRGIRPALVLDEGGVIIQGAVPGVARPVALIGIAEKGYLTLELTATASGGHSSMPPKHTAVGIISRAVTRLEAHPFPADLAFANRLFDRVGRYMPFAQRIIFANRWLFSPVLKRVLSASPTMNATIRTTTAATMFHAGVKENVLPQKATAVVNFRILPGETTASVIRRVKETIDDPRVSVRPLGYHVDPSPISETQSPAYTLLEATIRQVSEEPPVVAPFLVVGATDSRYFADLSSNVYRFLFLRLTTGDTHRLHGTNERIAIADYVDAIRFYDQLLKNLKRL